MEIPKPEFKIEKMPPGLQINKKPIKKKLLIGTPTTGIIRYEWSHFRYGQVIPVNWQASGYDLNYSVLGYSIEDAYNFIIDKFVKDDTEWLFFIEDDVLIPIDCFMKMGDYMNYEKIPIVSGLYYLKSSPTKPLVFRGRGNGAFLDFKVGDKVWCDAIPFGCLLIHGSIIRYLWENSPEYQAIDGTVLRKVIETPRRILIEPDTWITHSQTGTQDMFFCDRILNEDVLEKTGWEELAKEEFPFLCDTSIFCRHIDLHTGRQFP